MFDFLKKILKKKKKEEVISKPIPEKEKVVEDQVQKLGISKDRLEEIKKELEEQYKPKVEETPELPQPPAPEDIMPVEEEEIIKPPEPEKIEIPKPKKEIEEPTPAQPETKVSAVPRKPELAPEPKKVEIAPEPVVEKSGFFKTLSRFVSDVKLTDKSFDNLFNDLEINLLQNNVALEVVEKIKDQLRHDIIGKSIKRKEAADKVKTTLSYMLTSFFEKPQPINLINLVKEKKPIILLFIGVNGVGKTTTMAKVAKWLQDQNHSCVFAAADTFRAAAIEQLETHADNLNIKLIKHKYGADSAAVAFDAIEHAKAKDIDFVLIDTAGRSHSNTDLMSELEKVKKVAKPDVTLLVVDSLTGNDAVDQAKNFNEKIGIDGSILTKIDTDERGGAVISVAYITEKPILFLGTGQRYEDIEAFDSKRYIEKII